MARTRSARPGISSDKAKLPASDPEGTQTPAIPESPVSATEPPASGSRERRRRELRQRRLAAAAGETEGGAATIHRPVGSAGGLPPVGSAARRRREQQERKAALARGSGEPAPDPAGDPASRWLSSSEESEVRAFITSQSAQMEQRKYQMSLIKDFLGDPSRFGISPGDIPTSTSLQEFAERRRELQYRIATIKTFLDLLTEELRLLEQAEAYARKNGGGES